MKFEQVVTIFVIGIICTTGIVESVRFYNYPIPIPLENVPKGSSSNPSAGLGKGHPGNRDDDTHGTQFLVNNENDGSYHFGYDTGGGSPKSYREEIRDASGRIFGRYAYVDPDGILRITEYVADSEGFRSTESKRFLFDNSDLQLIGPIPKPLNDLYKRRRTLNNNFNSN